MSEIIDIAHDLALELHEVGAMDTLTLRKIEQLRIPEAPIFTAAKIRLIREKARMSQPVFARFLNVGATTVAQWEQGKKTPSGPSARLLDVIERKGIDAIA